MTETRERYYTLNPMESTALPDCVLAFLQEHVGREQAITAANIAREIGFRDPTGRKIRVAIAGLVAQGHPIAACNEGFFWTRTPEEADAYLADLRMRALDDFKRHKDYARAVDHLFGTVTQPLLW